jgi:hypothetical protein
MLHSSHPPWFDHCNLVNNTIYYEESHVFFSILSLFPPSKSQIFSSAPSSQIPSVCAFPLQETISHTCIKLRIKLWL